MKKFLVAIFSALIVAGCFNTLYSQEPPLKPTGLFDRSEVIMVWDEGTTNGARILEENLKLKFNYQGMDLGDRLLGAGKVVSDTTLSYSWRQIDLITGDFNGDNMADYLYSVTGKADSLLLVLARRGRTLNYTGKYIYKFNGRVLRGKNLILGDLDGDGLNEFVVGYRPFDQELAHVAVFGFDDDFKIELLNTIEIPVAVDDFVIDLADLDGTGDDELVIGYYDFQGSNEYFLRVYDFDEDLHPVEKDELKLDLKFGAQEYGSAALTGADIDSDGLDELVVAFTKNEHDSPNNPDTYLYTAALMDDPSTGAVDPLEMIHFYSDTYITGTFNYNGVWQILLKSGDLNGDGKTEVLLGCYSGVRIFTGKEDNQIEYHGQSSVNGFSENLPSINYFDVADVTGDDRDDIVALDHFFSNEPVGDQNFTLSMYQFDSTFQSTNIESAYQMNEIDNGGGGGRNETHYAVALSDFDGDLFRIGEFTSLGCFTNVIKPMTVLNTPPVHIDYINGVLHDVNECFGQNDCLSSVRKATEQFSQNEFSIESSSTGDWGFQTSVTLGVDQNFADIGGVYMAPVELTTFFGDNLEEVAYDKTTTSIGRSTGTSYFQTESMDRRFSRDDAILTIVSDYERWEYPVYNDQDEMLGEIVILIPRTTNQENWLRGRQSLEVAGMVQFHEPGNLLSYRKFVSTPEELIESNPDIREIISIANEHELDLGSTFTESITWGSEFENSDVSVENTVETQPGGGLNILGFQLRAQDKSVAKEELITSHVYKVGKNLGIEVFGSSLAANSYEYKVKPYYYWSKSGALVVDYMIDLSQGSFWQENYSIQDPGFILPNRLDSLKAKNEIDKITDLDEYLKTPSILFEPAIPVNGDTVVVTTIVHNLSLSPTSDPVEVSFYLGDPDRGGTLISDVEGGTVFTTEDVIEDQDYAIFDFKWKAEFERFDRMYAVIDPGGKLSENRLDNNKAWAPVQRFGDCGDPVSSQQIPFQAITLEDRFSIYPNPALGFVNLEYTGPDVSGVVVTITDLSGKNHLIDAIGFHELEYSPTLDISMLESGLYIIGISTDNYRQYTRLLIE
jgi:hypothetical protein